MMLRHIKWFLLLMIISSCVEEYWPDVTKYQGILVVDGTISNSNEPVSVSLTLSSPMNDVERIPVTGAEVMIIENEEIEITLDEISPGNYSVTDSSFRGKEGNSYQLNFILKDGREYKSTIDNLPDSAPIDSLYSVEKTLDERVGFHNITGLQFFLDNHNENCDTCYYLWRLSTTYKYESTFPIDYTWEGAFIPFPNPDSLFTCYKSNEISDIYIKSTRFLERPILKGVELLYVSTETKDLSLRYSLFVDQLTIGNDAYNFFDALEQQNIEQGELYTRQPIQIRGNVSNINDPDEPVLGYFLIAGSTTKRVFVNRPSLPFYYDICQPDFESMRFIRFEPESNWPIFITDIMFAGLATGSDYCFDCRLLGGELEKPGFWEE